MVNKIRIDTLLDSLLFIGLLFAGSGNFCILPLNLYQIIILVMFLIEVITKRKGLRLSKRILYLVGYISLITFLHRFDLESIKSLAYFSIMIITLWWYTLRKEKYSDIFIVLWKVAVVFSVYGIIQEIAFLLHVPQIYDLSLYGFAKNGEYISYGFLRSMSFYAEPSGAAGIVTVGIFIGLISNKEKYDFVKKWQFYSLFVYSFFTFSTVVYCSVCITVLLYLLFYNDKQNKRYKWYFLLSILLIVVLAGEGSLIEQVFMKFNQFKTLDVNSGRDMSAVALVTNFNVAFNKMMDGYIFGTGFDSHRLYYNHYINNMYSYVIKSVNFTDAASLYTRIFSEFGICGFLFFIFAIIKQFLWYLKQKKTISSILVLLFLILIIRDGNYTNFVNTYLFVIVFFTKKINE